MSNMDPLHIVLAAAAAIGVGLALAGGSARARRIRLRDPLNEVRREVAAAQQTPQGLVQEMELRLYDFGRSAEARIENHLAVLDRLIVEADREIARLEAILAESRHGLNADRPLSRSEQQRCFAMWEAGFTVEEIAACLTTTATQVQAALDEWRKPDQRAA
jgi:hypothetical protein